MSSSFNDPEHWRGRAEKMRRLAEDIKDAATKEMMLLRAIMRSSQCGPKNGQSAHRRPSKHLPRRRTVVIMRNGAAWRNRPEGDRNCSILSCR
jgi:hypothetical protein